MKTEVLPQESAPSVATSLPVKMLNIFLNPGEVFEEIASQPPKIATWLLPTSLVCLMALAFVHPEIAQQESGDTAANISARAHLLTAFDTCINIFLGTAWSAFVLWFIGRVCLKTRLSILKALEIIGLAGTVLILGGICTGLLISISGDDHARPALSLFLKHQNSKTAVYAVLDVFNLFHIWVAAVLAIGLSKLSHVPFKECAFWVFGYWIFARIGLILLA